MLSKSKTVSPVVDARWLKLEEVPAREPAYLVEERRVAASSATFHIMRRFSVLRRSSTSSANDWLN